MIVDLRRERRSRLDPDTSGTAVSLLPEPPGLTRGITQGREHGVRPQPWLAGFERVELGHAARGGETPEREAEERLPVLPASFEIHEMCGSGPGWCERRGFEEAIADQTLDREQVRVSGEG